MRKIYEHLDFTMVGYFQSILEEAGIDSCVRNAGASVGMGEIPFTEIFPELWVVDEEDYDRAMELLRPHHEALAAGAGRPWRCPRCRIEIEGTFGECWQCGGPAPDAAGRGPNDRPGGGSA